MTKTDLINYIKARIFTNGTKAVTAAKHQEALLALVDHFDTILSSLPAASFPASLYSVTSGTVGHLVKTNITNAEIGQLKIRFTGGNYTTLGIIDCEVTASINGAAITASSLQQLNKGTGIGAIAAFIDTDNTWAFFFPHNYRYVRADCEVTLKTSTAVTTAKAFSAVALLNRVTNIAHKTALPAGNETAYIKVSTTQMFSTNLTKTRTVYVATEDGNDGDMGAARTSSVKTVAQALALASHTGRLILYINKFKTAAPDAYAATTAYAVGDRAAYYGYAYERVTAGTGTAPSVTATVWKFVGLASTTKGTYNATTAYAVGDTVSWSNGTQTLTFVCKVATTGNAPANASNKYWSLCGYYNPVIPATTINYCNGLQIATESTTYNAAQPFVIVTGNLNLASNSDIIIATQFDVAGTLTFSYDNIFVSGLINTGAISVNYCGACRFNTTVNVFNGGVAITDSRATFYGATTVNTAALTTNGFYASVSATVRVYGALTVNGFNDGSVANSGYGVYAGQNSEITVYATVTANGFGTAVAVLTGGTYHNKSASHVLTKGTNTVPSGNTVAFFVDTGGTVINHKRAAITRTTTADNVTAAGQFSMQTNLGRTVEGDDNATGTVTDKGENLKVPIPVTIIAPTSSTTQAVAGTSTLRALLQIIVNNIANLFTAKANLASPTFTGAVSIPSKTAAATNTGTLVASEAQVYLKANNDDVVKLTGNQTIAGVKTFSSVPKIPSSNSAITAATATDVPATTGQVGNSCVLLTGAQTIAGNKTFSGTIQGATINASAGFFQSSDKRLKKDIRDIDRYLVDCAASIKLRSFRWEKDNADDVGVIAQEVEQVLPQVVREDENGFLTVDYTKLAMLKIEALERQVEALTKQVQELTNKINKIL